MIAPVEGSGLWPAWMARVPRCCALGFMLHRQKKVWVIVGAARFAPQLRRLDAYAPAQLLTLSALARKKQIQMHFTTQLCSMVGLPPFLHDSIRIGAIHRISISMQDRHGGSVNE